jgi:fused signal recognition particle receptor
MFGFLKKKLKEGIEKISNKLKETEEKKIEEVVEELKEELPEEEVKEIEAEKEEIIEEVKEEIKEIGMPKVEEEVFEGKKPEKKAKKKPKKSIVEKIKKKVVEKKISEDDIKEIVSDLEMSLIQSDVAVEVAEKITEDLKKNLVGKSIKRGKLEETIKKSFRNSIEEILDVETFDLVKRIKAKKPFLIVFVGFNGSGKTTTIARIGNLLKKNKISSVFAAADCFRAASIEQIEEHGKKLGINVIKHKYGADPAAVVFDAVKHAKSKGIDVVLADTAGRSHANVNLMEELKKIIRVNKPDLKILVLDSLTGNDIYDQCKLFNDAIDVDAMILTKTDVYEKGGAALAAAHTINKPILYMGVGQGYDDLEKFDKEKIIKTLLE